MVLAAPAVSSPIIPSLPSVVAKRRSGLMTSGADDGGAREPETFQPSFNMI
jgi:hypothetical protein